MWRVNWLCLSVMHWGRENPPLYPAGSRLLFWYNLVRWTTWAGIDYSFPSRTLAMVFFWISLVPS